MYSGLLKTYTGDVDKGKLEKLLHYNVYGGNMTRYNLFLITLRGINPAVDSSQIDNGKVLELLHMSFFILDDIIDNSNLRRGNPCWYIKRGMLSVKDAKFIMALTCS
ncbi:Farnesyl pyrophosphate synthase 2, partial [Nosema granulosis]